MRINNDVYYVLNDHLGSQVQLRILVELWLVSRGISPSGKRACPQIQTVDLANNLELSFFLLD